ncbi:transporter family-2 protein [Mariniphaga anaerophila]|uniref:Transporter family-2 protein n=1 Tax=Mariniphaga anaerophila TaxID=1484053 RepID=A0A1M5CAK9_9BACT|nr:DMT family transporter [Mariniphaga anaerophila]SHF51775.1 transporter family-2 protein [Mariniphaga anaerophila]
MKVFYTAIVLIIGCILAIQGSINTQLTTYLKHPLQGALVNFLVGFVSLVVINILFRTQTPDWGYVKTAPWYLFIGGTLGALFVSSIIFFIPRIGVSTVLAASIAGQLIAASIIDHFGFFGLAVHPISGGRIAGVLLLIAGIFLIQRY